MAMTLSLESSIIIGIDLGTTNSLGAYISKDGIKIVRDKEGRNMTPSMVTIMGDGSAIIGHDARDLRIKHPERTIYSVKRFMGKKLSEINLAGMSFPFKVVDDDKMAKIKIDNKLYSPQEISALILKEIKRKATGEIGKVINKAVITVPAYFDDIQRQATKDAAKIAGIQVERIINEPTAAALAYGLHKKENATIAVYDLGGGTFDISILKLSDGIFKVLSTAGDTFLGGDDFDFQLSCPIEDVLKEHGLTNDYLTRPEIIQEIKKLSEEVKIKLSDTDIASVLYEFAEGQSPIPISITRKQFNDLSLPLINRTLKSCQRALDDAELQPSDIDEVVMVGGSTRVPIVREKVEEFFGKNPHTEVNPDEVVAVGAAVQANILMGGYKDDYLLLDVIPLSLGIETMGGTVAKLIQRNTTIPSSVSEEFTTYMANQTGVDIHVVQGERELVKDNRSLGRFKLNDIPPMPAGYPKIKVTFTVDANGILTVSANEERSGQKASIQVTPSHGLTDNEVDQMIKDAMDHAKDDFEARRFLDLKTEAGRIIHATRRAIEQAGSIVTQEDLSMINNAISEVEKMMGGSSHDALDKSVTLLNEVTLPLAERLMNSSAQEALQNKDVHSFL